MSDNEIWCNLDFMGFSNYEVSNIGKVRSIDRYVSTYNGGKYLRKGCIMAGCKNNKGYRLVTLLNNCKRKTFSVHRLVAEAFLPNPDNLPQVNHKDECKTNNFVCINKDGTVDYSKTNLEWVTAKQNINHGSCIKRRSEKQTNDPKRSKRISQYTLDMEFVREWPSAYEINRVLGFNRQNITNCCLKRYGYKTANGFIWRYAS